MKIFTKKTILGTALLAGSVVLLSGCTANFCSEKDKASMLYPYERGVTVYTDSAGYHKYYDDKYGVDSEYYQFVDELYGLGGQLWEENSDIYYYVPLNAPTTSTLYTTYAAQSATKGVINTYLSQAYTNGYYLPSPLYWATMDQYAVDEAAKACFEAHSKDYSSLEDFKSKVKIASKTSDINETDWFINPYLEHDCVGGDGTTSINKSILRVYGYLRYGTEGKDDVMYGRMDNWYKQLINGEEPGLLVEDCPSLDFYEGYKTALSNKVTNNRACATITGGYYGHYGPSSDWTVAISKKDWGYAWNKGFLEGLLVYPVSWLVDTFAIGMDPALSGVGQIWALVFVTLIVRGLLILLTFKSTMDGQKMQALQPQLAKIQAKYPNANTNQAEKARMAQEQSALYKRNKINPLSQILMLIIQFPVFICVWSGLQGSAALSTGKFLNLNLSDTIQSVLFDIQGNWYLNSNGWWTALVLFVLMAGVQIAAMLLPKWFQKRANKGVAKLGKNPAQASQGKTMKWVTIFMMGFTIVMGFFLPSAMGVYWLIGGLIGMVQTVITQLIMAKKAKKKGN